MEDTQVVIESSNRDSRMLIPSCNLIKNSSIHTTVDEGRGKMDIISASVTKLGGKRQYLK